MSSIVRINAFQPQLVHYQGGDGSTIHLVYAPTGHEKMGQKITTLTLGKTWVNILQQWNALDKITADEMLQFLEMEHRAGRLPQFAYVDLCSCGRHGKLFFSFEGFPTIISSITEWTDKKLMREHFQTTVDDQSNLSWSPLLMKEALAAIASCKLPEEPLTQEELAAVDCEYLRRTPVIIFSTQSGGEEFPPPKGKPN